MNRKKLFLGIGGLLLVVAGVFAGRARAKYGNATKLYATSGGGSCIEIAVIASTSYIVTGTGFVCQLTFTSSADWVVWNVYATAACVRKAYFRP